jgi:hypothetical protein
MANLLSGLKLQCDLVCRSNFNLKGIRQRYQGSPHSKGSADLCAHFIFSLLFVNIRVYSWLSGHNHKIR